MQQPNPSTPPPERSPAAAKLPLKPSTLPAPTARKLPPPPKAQSPFVYLGIPQFVLDWRPSRPGPKMSAFLAVTTALTAAYVYDRNECDRLQKEYIDQVKFMSEAALEAGENARVVRVYAARVPEDGDEQRSAVWFKRYIRPILVASGTDYQIKIGSTPGGLGRTLISEIRGRRILEAATAQAGGAPASAAYTAAGPDLSAILNERDAAARAAELEGGIVLLGRNALKEYLWALKKGYGEEIDLKEEARLEGLGLGANERRKDGRWEREEELLVRELEREDAKNPKAPFNESDVPEGLASVGAELGDDDAKAVVSTMVNSIGYGAVPYGKPPPLKKQQTPPAAVAQTNDEPLILPPRPTIPPQPPLLLVPFTHTFGVTSWIPKLLHFWNHRTEVRFGGEAALQLLAATTRPLDPPTIRTGSGAIQGQIDLDFVQRVRTGEEFETSMEEGVPTGSADLDFMSASDEFPSHFRRTYRKLPTNHEYSRRTYYTTDLPPRLQTARELAAGREPTSAESKFMPKMESELRKERLEKELRWRRELEGWAVQRSGSGVGWEEGWGEGGVFRVYDSVGEEQRDALRRAKESWDADKARRELERDHRLGSD